MTPHAPAYTPPSPAASAARLVRYELADALRNRATLVYGLFFLAATEALFRFGGSGPQVLASLLNVVLLLVPLVAVVFGTMHLYHRREYAELMLTQPIRRGVLFTGLYTGLALPLVLAFVLGVGAPFAVHGLPAGFGGAFGLLLAAGAGLTLVFTALAFGFALRFDDRVRGLAAAVGAWLGFAVLYDAGVLAVVHAFADYPLERPLIALTLLNPVDLARVALLLQFDVSALMGYTGAVFERFFGSGLGLVVTLGALALWVAGPLSWAGRLFARKDF